MNKRFSIDSQMDERERERERYCIQIHNSSVNLAGREMSIHKAKKNVSLRDRPNFSKKLVSFFFFFLLAFLYTLKYKQYCF